MGLNPNQAPKIGYRPPFWSVLSPANSQWDCKLFTECCWLKHLINFEQPLGTWMVFKMLYRSNNSDEDLRVWNRGAAFQRKRSEKLFKYTFGGIPCTLINSSRAEEEGKVGIKRKWSRRLEPPPPISRCW